jgi:hypothetical protein
MQWRGEEEDIHKGRTLSPPILDPYSCENRASPLTLTSKARPIFGNWWNWDRVLAETEVSTDVHAGDAGSRGAIMALKGKDHRSEPQWSVSKNHDVD